MSEETKSAGSQKDPADAAAPENGASAEKTSSRKPSGARNSANTKKVGGDSFIVARGRTVHTQSGALGPGKDYDGPAEDAPALLEAGFLLKRSDMSEQTEANPGITRS